MKSQLDWNDYQELELIRPAAKAKRSDNWLKRLWQSLSTHLNSSSDPYVWQTEAANGQIVWNAYDPVTQRRIERVSANELRAWLEKRYYQAC
jgi:hypothetical protein